MGFASPTLGQPGSLACFPSLPARGGGAGRELPGKPGDDFHLNFTSKSFERLWKNRFGYQKFKRQRQLTAI
jgi:hypothetical protein